MAVREEITIKGSAYHKGAGTFKALVHRIKGPPQKKQKALIFFHGGGVVFGTRFSEAVTCDRYAIESNAVVINVDYRLAPENPLPAGYLDGYAAVKWVIANADRLGIDKNRIGTLGDSGGGLITSGVGFELAKRGEGDLI